MQYLDIPPTENVLFTVKGHLGVITLNRPNQMNALNFAMVNKLYKQLNDWQKDTSVHAILIHGAGERAFCAGGDIVEIYTTHQKKSAPIEHFYEKEYQLNSYIKNYPKPYIAIMDGITMGGGAGLSIHGTFRIATERLRFAMPETGIGFFPDAGSTYFLSRCPGKAGIYLGLTGSIINVSDAQYAQLIDSIISYQHMTSLITTLAEQPAITSSTIQACLMRLQQPATPASLQQYDTIIDYCFSADTVEEIMQRLKENNHPWSQETFHLLKKRAPTSLKVTLTALRRAANLTFTECMQMEYQLARHFAYSHDLYEGIRAQVIDKDRQPRWQPDKLSEVTDTMISQYFNPSTLA